MAFLDSVLGWIGQNKAVCALSVLLFAFFISTIALAVQKNNLAAELETCGVTTPPPTSPPESFKHRLPSNIIPTHYELFLHPNLVDETFTGNVTISLKVLETASHIVLNSNKLTITSVALHSPSSQAIDTEHELSEEFESLRVTPKSGNLAVTTDTSTYSLVIEFNGVMHDKNVGLYSSKYRRVNGNNEVTISSSKFQPTYARQAFPCFDEPAFKATYSISLVRPRQNDYIALSNMPQLEVTDGPGENEVTVKFAQSPQMSTYLAVFLVADFQHEAVEIVNPLGDNFDLKIYLPEGQQEKGKFALNAAKNIIEYYIEYFDIEYPLPKLDMAAIPEYVSGATEHWGLVTFRETSLLWEEGEGSSRNKQRVASVISHELAHMWFGNLVTCEWWNDIWLNEGFASYIEFKGLAWLNWNMDEQFLIEDLHGVMELDSKVASHPIVQQATTPDEITALFDSIAYSKGASIIRMLEGFVTSEVFRTGVQKFLRDFRYKSVVTADFFRYMDEVTDDDMNVTQIMSTWTEQKGYPVVFVKRVNDTTYELTQERFLLNPDSKEEETEDSPFLWHIPITYMSDKTNSDKVLWMKPTDTNIQINIGSESKWIKVNDKQIGYYIVNYDNWDEIINQVKIGDKFTAMDRAQLLHDSFKLADSLSISYNVPLELSTYLTLKTETNYVPWSVASSKFLSLQGMLDYPSLNLIRYVQEEILQIYDFVNPVNIDNDGPDDHLKKLLREKIMNLACHFDYSDCLTYVKEHFARYLANENEKPNVDIRQSVYYHGMRDVFNRADWDKIFDRFVKENDPQERAKLMEALAGTSSQLLLGVYLDIAQNKTGPIKKQDYVSVMQYIAYNRNGEQLVWKYVRENWEAITQIIDVNDRTLGRMIPNITKRFKTEAQLKELEEFIEKYPNAGAGEAGRKEALETIKYNIKWSAQNKEVINTWLTEHFDS